MSTTYFVILIIRFGISDVFFEDLDCVTTKVEKLFLS